MYFAGHNMEINHTVFSNNAALGGAGGAGRASTTSTAAGQAGGAGGNARGGGLYIASVATVFLDTHTRVSNNTADIDPDIHGAYTLQN